MFKLKPLAKVVLAASFGWVSLTCVACLEAKAEIEVEGVSSAERGEGEDGRRRVAVQGWRGVEG